MNKLMIILTISLIGSLFVVIYYLKIYYGTPCITFYQVDSKSKEEWRLYDNRPGDTFYIKYYTIVVDGYHDLRQYKKILDEKFCSLVPKDVAKFRVFYVDFIKRSRLTKENMSYSQFNRHYHNYMIAGYSCEFGKNYLKQFYIENDVNRNYITEKIECKF